MKALLIAGATSGAGKTTIATGLMSALKKRGLSVQPFKTGPDYIDPTYHTWATGTTSRNLDTWMLPYETVIELFHRAMRGKDIGIIEGVMGLYDGLSHSSDEASTAELAKLLNLPVILVLDAHRSSRSLAAMVKGYQSFDPKVNIAGVILNNIGSQSHFESCSKAIEHYCDVRVVGHLKREQNLRLPERHLGLIPTVENPASQDFLDRLTQHVLENFDIDLLLNLAEVTAPCTESKVFNINSRVTKVRIGIAMDRAFNFYYQDSLDLLINYGAELVYFSPMADEQLPDNISGMYIGGGFPELYASELGKNTTLKENIKQVIERGMPVYAECGGLMYLSKSIRDFSGNVYDMVGVLPVSCQITSPKLSLGYREVEAISDGPLMKRGQVTRGHEFHWSVLDSSQIEPNAYRVINKGNYIEGFHAGNVLASYIHLHFCSMPSMAKNFVEACLKFKNSCVTGRYA